MKVPREQYVETFLDAGDNDMIRRAFAPCSGGLSASAASRPRAGSSQATAAASVAVWGYAVGQIKAMMRQL